MTKNILKLIVIGSLSLCCVGCGGGGGGDDKPPTPPVPILNGTVHVIFDSVADCPRTVSTYTDVIIAQGPGPSYTFIQESGVTMYPSLGDTTNFSKVPVDVSLTLTSKPTAVFQCGTNNYQYPGRNEQFTIPGSTPEFTFHIAAVKVNGSDSDNFHFANTGENSISSKWDNGKIKN